MIKIKSVTRNANAGSTLSKVLTGITRIITSEKSPEEMKQLLGKDFKLIEHNMCQGIHATTGYYFGSGYPEIESSSLEIRHEYQDINHAPIPEYSVEYEDKLFKCEECEQMVNWKDLYSDCGYDWYCDDFCPNCNDSSGINLKFQTVEDYLEIENEN